MMRIVLTLPGPPSSLGAEVRTPTVIEWTNRSSEPIPLGRGEVQFITEMSIDGVDLEAVNNVFRDSGIPQLWSRDTVYYYGDTARFIVGNLRLRGETR